MNKHQYHEPQNNFYKKGNPTIHQYSSKLFCKGYPVKHNRLGVLNNFVTIAVLVFGFLICSQNQHQYPTSTPKNKKKTHQMPFITNNKTRPLQQQFPIHLPNRILLRFATQLNHLLIGITVGWGAGIFGVGGFAEGDEEGVPDDEDSLCFFPFVDFFEAVFVLFCFRDGEC